jgi:hypothetical protein
MGRRPTRIALTLTAALVCGACGAGETDNLQPTPSAAAAVTDRAAPADAMTQSDAAAGAEAAVRAMQAFTARLLPYEQWWAGLEPLLTPEAQWLFESTDPWKVPASAVTGDGQVLSAPDSTFLVVSVPTDVGAYRLEMTRQSVEHPWLVATITAPPELS